MVEELRLFMDRASRSQGNRVGIVLISPHEEVVEYSLKFSFLISNKIAKYEALVVGMMLAKQMKRNDS